MNKVQLLSRQVANFQLLNYKLHHYHWRVSGPHFFTLHAKFEEYYDRTAAYMDEIAERILALGGEPPTTLSQILQLASIEEASGGETAEQMIQALIGDMETIGGQLKEAIALAEAEEDRPTADMLVAIQTELEKNNWMLRAYLA